MIIEAVKGREVKGERIKMKGRKERGLMNPFTFHLSPLTVRSAKRGAPHD